MSSNPRERPEADTPTPAAADTPTPPEADPAAPLEADAPAPPEADTQAPPASAAAPNGRAPAKTTRERAAEKREAKLEFVRQQVEEGVLVIRRMTDEERNRYPPRAGRPNEPRRR